MRANATARFQRGVFVLALATWVLLGFRSPAHAVQTVTLAWDADTTNSQMAGYRVYYGTTSGSYSQMLDNGNANTISVSGLTDNAVYYFVVTEYSMQGLESPVSNEVSASTTVATPVVSLANPGSTLNGPVDITLTASASESNGTITKVAFYAGSAKLGETTASPYSIVWPNAQPGSYQLSAVAYDSQGNSASSNVVPVTVVKFGVTALQPGSNGCQITLTAAPGVQYNVYYSDDLQNWSILTRVTSTNGSSIVLTDGTAGGVPRRFYKVAPSPGTAGNTAMVSGLKRAARE